MLFRSVIRGMSGSGPFGADAHIAWLGHPAQLSARPAFSDSGPGQCSAEYVVSILYVRDGVKRGGGAQRTWLRRNKLGRCLEGRVEIDLGRLFQ